MTLNSYVALYDNESKYDDEFQANLEICKNEFRKTYPDDQNIELTCVCAPGRVNLIGEHIDYNDGFVLPMAIPLYTIVMGCKNNDPNGVCRVKSLDDFFAKNDYMEFSLNDLKPKSIKPNWINYIIGVVANFSGFDTIFF